MKRETIQLLVLPGLTMQGKDIYNTPGVCAASLVTLCLDSITTPCCPTVEALLPDGRDPVARMVEVCCPINDALLS
jgi:hypothetical protein